MSGAARLGIWLLTVPLVFVAMELWAALLHGRIWHGLLWRVHRSHHRLRRLGERLEANDALSLLHAPIAITLILYGCRGAEGVAREVAFGVGLGMTLFGIAYLVVHDGMVHGRLPVQGLLRFRYFARVRDAHQMHHRGRDVPPFGLFFGPLELRQRPRTASESTLPAQRTDAEGPSPRSTSPNTSGRFRAVSRTNR